MEKQRPILHRTESLSALAYLIFLLISFGSLLVAVCCWWLADLFRPNLNKLLKLSIMSTDNKTTAPAPTTATAAATAPAPALGADGRPKTIVNVKDLPKIAFDHTMPLFALAGVNPILEQAKIYTATRQFLGRTAGSSQLGCSYYTVEKGCVGAPYHYHDANEEAIYVLEGSGTLRLGGQFMPISAGDYMSFAAPGSAAHAHQIVNTGADGKPLKYLCLSTMILPEVCTYPDTGKIGVITVGGGRNFQLFSTTSAVPYFSDEPIPPNAVPKVAAADNKSAPPPSVAAQPVKVSTDTKKPIIAPNASNTLDAKSRPKCVVASADVAPYTWNDLPQPFFAMTELITKSGKYEFSAKPLASACGAVALGATLYEVAPGKVAWLMHSHFPNEEAIFIVSGSGTLRLTTGSYAVGAGDYIALLSAKPEALPDSAHQLFNTGTEPLKYLCVSTRRSPELTTYPDSKKFGVLLPNDIDYIVFPEAARSDYWVGEPVPSVKPPTPATATAGSGGAGAGAGAAPTTK